MEKGRKNVSKNKKYEKCIGCRLVGDSDCHNFPNLLSLWAPFTQFISSLQLLNTLLYSTKFFKNKISDYFFLDCWYILPLISHNKSQTPIKFQLLLNSHLKWMSGFWCNQLQFWHHNLINIKLLMQCNWCTIIPCKWNLTFFNTNNSATKYIKGEN